MTRMCADWCGGGCTKEQHDQALRLATQTARGLGKLFHLDWVPAVSENLGWHAKVRSRCGRIEVAIHTYPGRKCSYTAFFGNGHWAAQGRTASGAVRAVVREAHQHLETITAYLKGLTP